MASFELDHRLLTIFDCRDLIVVIEEHAQLGGRQGVIRVVITDVTAVNATLCHLIVVEGSCHDHDVFLRLSVKLELGGRDRGPYVARSAERRTHVAVHDIVGEQKAMALPYAGVFTEVVHPSFVGDLQHHPSPVRHLGHGDR